MDTNVSVGDWILAIGAVLFLLWWFGGAVLEFFVTIFEILGWIAQLLVKVSRALFGGRTSPAGSQSAAAPSIHPAPTVQSAVDPPVPAQDAPDPKNSVAAIFTAQAAVTADGATIHEETSGLLTDEFAQLGFDQRPPLNFDLKHITTVAMSARRTALRVKDHQIDIALDEGTTIRLTGFEDGTASPDELFTGLALLAADRRIEHDRLTPEHRAYLGELGEHIHATEDGSGFRLAVDLRAPTGAPDTPGDLGGSTPDIEPPPRHQATVPAAESKLAAAPDAEPVGSAPTREGGLRVESGTDSATTREEINAVCGFRVEGDRVGEAQLGTPTMGFTTWVNVDQDRSELTTREQAIAKSMQGQLTPTAAGAISRVVGDIGHVVAHPGGFAALVDSSGHLVGASVAWRDVSAVEIECVEAAIRDELQNIRARPKDVRPKSASILTLRGGERDGVAAFAISFELDELRKKLLRKAKRDEVWEFCTHIRASWARAQLARSDLTPDQRQRVEAHLAGTWDHVVIRDKDGDHAEWLLASIDPPAYGTIGFPRPSTFDAAESV